MTKHDARHEDRDPMDIPQDDRGPLMLSGGMTVQSVRIQRMLIDRCEQCGSNDTTYADWMWDEEDEHPYGTKCNVCGYDSVSTPDVLFHEPGTEGSHDSWEDYCDDDLG